MGLLQSLLGAPKALALEVKQDHVRALVIEGSGSTWTEKYFVERALPKGVIEHGEIKDVQILANEIRLATDLKEAGLDIKRVVTSIPESLVYLLHTQIPAETERADVTDVVLAEAAKQLPLGLDECTWDFKQTRVEEGMMQVMFAAARTEYVEALEQAVTLAGLTLHVAEPESQVLTRSLIHGIALDEKMAVLICDVGRHGANAIIVDQEGIERSIWEAAGAEALIDALNKKGKIKKPEVLLWKVGLKDEGIAQVVTTWMDERWADLASELAQYEKVSQRLVHGICYTGEGSRIPGLTERWSKRLGRETFSDCTPPITPAHLTQHSGAVIVGLGMRAAKLSPGLNFIVPT